MRIIIAAVLALAASAVTAASTMQFNLPQQSLAKSLQAVGSHTNLNILFDPPLVAGRTSPAVNATLTADQALAKILAGTGLKHQFLNESTVVLTPATPDKKGAATAARTNGHLAAQIPTQMVQQATVPAPRQVGAETEDPPADSSSDGIPEMLVRGARGASADIRRSNDDVQPYVVFDSEDLERSMAPSLDDFLRTRLPMNQSRTRSDQGSLNAQGNMSSIDLRGLGTEETLILVNGRRMPGVADIAGTIQADINGIPLSAVERIEVLPSTAGGIYGGGATGGVVNIVLKRDYQSVAVTARYDGTFEGGGSERRLDATGGFSLGNTSVILMASMRDGKPLYVGDRDFARRSRELQFRNNPAAFTNAGNPVFGYTTNIRSTNGQNLVLRNGTSLGSPIAHVAEGSAGYAVDGAFAFRPGYNLNLAESTFGNQDSLLTVPSVSSVQLNLRHEFNDRISVFLDAGRYQNKTIRKGNFGVELTGQGIINIPAMLPDGVTPNPANPFQQNIRLAVPMVGFDTDRLETPSDSLSDRFGGGVTVRLAGDWLAHAEFTYGISDNNYTYSLFALDPAAFTALANGTLNPLRDVNRFPFDFSPYYAQPAAARPVGVTFPTEQQTGTVRVSGPLMNLPGGALRLSTLVERREEYTGDRLYATVFNGAPYYLYWADVGSRTDSAYAEVNAPLFSRGNARPGIHSLELMASYRYDDTANRTRPYYDSQVVVPTPDGPFPDVPSETRSVSANQYTLGFRYAPVESAALRVSYGKGVLPPTSQQLAITDFGSIGGTPPGTLIDQKRGGRPISDQPPIQVYTTGGRPDLRPEQSESLSVGLIFKPTVLPGLRLSVDYTRIQKIDEIGTISEQSLLDQEDLFPGSVVRNPLTQADINAGYTGGTIREFNTGPVNIAEMEVNAFDVQVTYDWDTRFGSFTADLVGTIQPSRKQRSTPTSPERNPVGYSNGPMKVRANGGVRWSLDNIDLGWNMQYYDSYLLYSDTASPATRANTILSQGSPSIPTQTYHDIYGRYRFGETFGFAGGLFKNSELMLSVQNALNTLPPTRASIAATALGSLYAGEGSPLLRRYSLSFKKEFR